MTRDAAKGLEFIGSPVSEQAPHHAADQSTWTATTAVTASAATTGGTVVTGFVVAAAKVNAKAGARR